MGSEVNNKPIRDHNLNVMHTMRVPFTFADNGKVLRAGVAVPAGALLHKPLTGVDVQEAFNAGTTNVAHVGIPSNTDLYGTSLALGSVAFVPIDEAVSMKLDVDTYIVTEIALTGTTATTGQAEMVVSFSPVADTPVLSVSTD